MIQHLFNHPMILHQTADNANDIPELPIAACIDNGGVICLSQEGRAIIVNRNSVLELCKLLRELGKAAEA